VVFVCASALAFAPAALASSPATSAYGGACATASLCVSSSIGSKTTSPATTTKSADTGSLPFTGINLIELAAMGLVLTGAGFLVRRGRRPSND